MLIATILASVNVYSTEQINYEYVDVDFKNVDTKEKIWKLIFWSMKIKILQSKIVMRVYMEFTEMILIELQVNKMVEQAVVATMIMEW